VFDLFALWLDMLCILAMFLALPCSPGYLAERMASMDEFKRDEMPAVSLIELLPLLDSSDMGPEGILLPIYGVSVSVHLLCWSDYIRIATTIEECYYEYDSFVVIMGTDTMVRNTCSLDLLDQFAACAYLLICVILS
jgi:hypothetical protein